jgi:hypothetical protein
VSLFSLAEFAAKLVAIDRDLKAAQPEILAEGYAMVAGRAKDRSQAQADDGGFQRDDAGRR